MTAFTISPYIGPLPLRFGMTPQEVAAILGPHTDAFPSHRGGRIEHRSRINVGYAAANGKLIEVVFTPGAILQYEGQSLFDVPDLIGFLGKYDSKPQLFVGNVVFSELGISLSGFHDNDESQKAIAVHCRGYLDEYVDDFVPFPREA